MNKSIVINKAELQKQKLIEVLSNINLNIAEKSDINKTLYEIAELEKSLNVLEFILNQQELSPEMNIHLKLMEESIPVTETIVESHNVEVIEKEEIQTEENVNLRSDTAPIETSSEQTSSEAIDDSNRERKSFISTNNNSSKKLEVPLNDRFRLINELFHQNQQEYQIAIEQLNTVVSIQEAEVYLNSLAELYKWDTEKAAYKILVRVVNKRFL